jgi:hypothetical protein
LARASPDVYRQSGAALEAVELPASVTEIANMISFVLTTEGAAAFDDLMRSKDASDPSLNTWVELMVTRQLYDESTLAAALAFERATTWHTKNPSL